MCPAYDSELSFITGVDENGKVAQTSYYTWKDDKPATYSDLSGAIKWGSPTPGTAGGNVSYSFEPSSNWTSDERAAWIGGFDLWAAVANITFSEAPSSANITIKRGTDGKAFADFGTQTENPIGSTVIATPNSTGPLISIDTNVGTFGPIGGSLDDKGGYPYSTVLHEIGHILGMGHSGPYNSVVDLKTQQFGPYDTQLWSIMSYIAPGDAAAAYFNQYPVADTSWGVNGANYSNEPLTPMMLDILAIQRLYGASSSSDFDGGDTFGFNATISGYIGKFYDFSQNTNAIVTLWDWGTGNSLNLSGFSEDAVVSLAPGTFSSVGGHINNLGVAFDTVIETAIGGSGNDQITASNANSTLRGGDGNDMLIGAAGNDDLKGEAGNDVLRAGTGVDRLDGGSGNDTFGFGLSGANGDTVVDFSGVNAGGGDRLQFFGYGSAADGASFTQVDATHWSINSSDGAVQNVVTFDNAPTITAADYTFLPTYSTLDHSGYLDFTGYRLTGDTSVAAAYNMVAADISLASDAKFNVAIILERSADPTALLEENWGTRQQTLEQLSDAGTLWITYGADQATYTEVRRALEDDYGLTILDDSNGSTKGHYITSAESRTIWVEMDTAEQFSNLFQTTLYKYDGSSEFRFWNGNLSLPDEWGVTGLWIDTANAPNGKPLAGGTQSLQQGPQGIGNASPDQPGIDPHLIAEMYNFPLKDRSVVTDLIGLVEPGIGSALPSGDFQARLRTYLDNLERSGDGVVTTQGSDGQSWTTWSGNAGERSMDVGVVAAINPDSDIRLYTGSGSNGYADSSIFTSLQSAIWDRTYNPSVVSSSFSDPQVMDPRSPFYRAYSELYVDSALRNMSIFNALGDGGSGNETSNGLTNLDYNSTFPYTVLVGGTSISSHAAADRDPTLHDAYLVPALQDNLNTIWRLVAGGLRTLPSDAADIKYFVETVWNQYYLDGNKLKAYNEGGYYDNPFNNNWTSSGGVDPTQPTPWYQTAYGLTPVTADPWQQTGRGAPDVAADAGGNLNYLVPNEYMLDPTANGGTSAASPLWAALALQFNTIFDDQGLPDLGYMNDLLYIASVIAPGAFNDVSLGANLSSFYNDVNGPYINGGNNIQPTGYGYTAGYGYDYVSGLGSPNGLLLARALTTIGHAQYFGTSPDMLVSDGNGGWTSGANQTLLFQTMSNNGGTVGVDLGPDGYDFGSGNSAGYAWTNQFAQQSLQPDFDPGLVLMFDKQWQGAEAQFAVSAGESVSLSVNGTSATASQGTLSSPYGFADFLTNGGTGGTDGSVVRVARAVAVAETAGGQDDQMAVVRLRQGGQDSLTLSFYKVDDLSGTISLNGSTYQPGDAGYLQAAQQRVYELSSGGTSINGPGYGGYAQTDLLHVDAGDMIAMALLNQSSGQLYWPFAQANENVNGAQVSHLWNYGLNTWGWEDVYAGGDHDYNDMVVGFDFTSHAGHSWLV